MPRTNNLWITIVLITAIIMLVFLVFYGNKAPMPTNPGEINPADPTKVEEPVQNLKK